MVRRATINDLRDHEKGDGVGDGVIDPMSHQETTLQPEHFEPSFLLEPDVTVALMLHGAEVSIPWFSEELQKRAIAGVTDYLRFGEGCSWDVNQAFRIQHTIRFRPRSKYPIDAVVQMRGWLDVWLEFYVLKGDEECVDRVKALQTTFRYLTSAHSTRKRGGSAGVQSRVTQAEDEEPNKHTDADVAEAANKRSFTTSNTKNSHFDQENSPKIVIATQKPTATPEIRRNKIRENKDTNSKGVSQESSSMPAKSQKPVLGTRVQDTCQLASNSSETLCPAPKKATRKSSRLRVQEAEPQQVKTPVSEIMGGKYETHCFVMRNGVLRNVEDESENSCAKDCRFNTDASDRVHLGDASMESSNTLEQPVISPFLGYSTPTSIQRGPQLSKATPNPISRGRTAVSPSNRAVPEPTPTSRFFILQDPFGKMHTIPLDQHWRIYLETLVQLECYRHDIEKAELITNHCYDLFNSQGFKLTTNLLETDIEQGDCVRMCFWESSAAP
ncbi:hypothetical protein G7Y79_00016g040650 [Physcia stellaris]|nr:hypothetical protein G7Y79_00016g040650 [Physcia stellaris]